MLYALVRSTFRVDTSGMVHLRAEPVTGDALEAVAAEGPTHRVRPARPFDVRMFSQVNPSACCRVKPSCMVNDVTAHAPFDAIGLAERVG